MTRGCKEAKFTKARKPLQWSRRLHLRTNSVYILLGSGSCVIAEECGLILTSQKPTVCIFIIATSASQ